MINNVPAKWRNFYNEVNAAMVSNMRNPRCVMWDEFDLGMWMRDALPYIYDPREPVVDLRTAEARGYAACGEAAAAVMASAKLRRRSTIFLCLQERPDLDPDYAHVVATIDGVPQDVYSVAALPAAGCVLRWGF